MNFIYDALGLVFGPIMSAIYHLVNNYGVAIILFTIFCRILMLPSAISQQKNAAKNQRITYKMRKITEKYKDDKQRQMQEQQEFYKREGYNPMSAGCSGGMLLQFPIIFGLIAAVYRPLQYTVKIDGRLIHSLSPNLIEKLSAAAVEFFKDAEGKATILANNLQIQLRITEKIDMFKGLFGQGKLDLSVFNGIPKFDAAKFTELFGPDKLDAKFFTAISEFAEHFRFGPWQLGLTPKEGGTFIYYLIPILAGLTSMAASLYSTLRQRKTNPGQQQGMAMMIVMSLGMPAISAWFALGFPVGIGIYWIVSSLVQLIQTVVLSFTHPPQKMLAKSMVDETIERRSRENSRKKVAEIN